MRVVDGWRVGCSEINFAVRINNTYYTMADKSTKSESVTPQSITIQGVTYPVVITMGAFLEFHRITGREATEITSSQLSDTLILLHAILRSGQRRGGYSYPYETVEDLASELTPEEMQSIRLA